MRAIVDAVPTPLLVLVVVGAVVGIVPLAPFKEGELAPFLAPSR
jgi:hypothetical protein